MASRDLASIRFSMPISSLAPNGLVVAWWKVAAYAAIRFFCASVTTVGVHMACSCLLRFDLSGTDALGAPRATRMRALPDETGTASLHGRFRPGPLVRR